MSVKGLVAALNSSGKYRFKLPEYAVDHLVVGGGLAIAQRLSQRFPDKSTYLVERRPRAGEEISSRNSEVIHSGLYYPPNSLKTRLCLRGRELLYDRCMQHGVPYRKTGKLVVANEHQRGYVEDLHAKAIKLEWPKHSNPQPGARVLPTELISGDEARGLEPDLSTDIVAALLSPETGIVDSHGLMEDLEKDITESEGGELVYSTRVVRVDPYKGDEEGGWVVQTVTGDADTGDAMLARTVINASGLSSPFILNSLLPENLRIPIYYARGSCASYKGPGIASISRLIYPCPETGNASFQSLGTHLTLDLDGKVRFGPDLEWISPPTDDESSIDFWEKHLVPGESRLHEMHRAVTSYLPEVVLDGLQPDYVGVRPKLVGPKGGFEDFRVRVDHPSQFGGNGGESTPMISLLGIESPGLTSCLAIAEMVVEDVMTKKSQ
ncbi:hypothetical protein PLICRDRAFT_170512 [Plicaturopsis crispa FD-325 SS-3]|nr:hypothetical protein PLICRDRAFT_170512 [Plicaturopsis crispa FD-325 SS-3]